jgi:putative oxidoreductase
MNGGALLSGPLPPAPRWRACSRFSSVFRSNQLPMSRKWDASLLVRIVLGFVLLAAGLTKIGEHLAFAQSIANYRLLPEAWHVALALSLPWVEILVGLCLLGGLLFRGASLLALSLFGGFAVFVVSALARGLNVEVSWAHAAVDLVLLLLAAYLLRRGPGKISLDAEFGLEEWSSRKAGVAGVLILLLMGANIVASRHILPLAAPGSNTNPSHPISPPPLAFDPPVLNFGPVPQEKEAEAEVSFKNVSEQAVTIRSVSSSCNCTVPTPDKVTLAPGESGTFTVKFHPGVNRGESNQTVSVLLEGRQEPVSFQVKAYVVGAVEVVPPVLELEVGKPQTFKLVAKRDKLSLGALKFDSPTSLVEFKVLSQDQSTSTVEALLTAALPVPNNGTSVWPVPIHIQGAPSSVVYVKEKGTP